GLNPSPAWSAHARSSASRTNVPCPLARPANGLQSPACPWRLRRTAPSAPHCLSETPTGSGSREGPRSPACAPPPACTQPPLHPPVEGPVDVAEVDIVAHIIWLQAQLLSKFLQGLFPISLEDETIPQASVWRVVSWVSLLPQFECLLRLLPLHPSHRVVGPFDEEPFPFAYLVPQ